MIQVLKWDVETGSSVIGAFGGKGRGAVVVMSEKDSPRGQQGKPEEGSEGTAFDVQIPVFARSECKSRLGHSSIESL